MSRLKELEKRLRDEPDNLGLRVIVAGALREAGRQDDAVELYRSVAIAYRDQGRSQQAIAVCRSILEIAPADVRCHALLAALVADHKGRANRDAAQVSGDEIEPALAVPAATVPARVRPPTMPAAASKGVSVPFPRTTPPPRRSSLDETPLPGAMPYHVADPTTKNLVKLSQAELDEPAPSAPSPDDEGLPVAEGATTRPGADDHTRPGVKGIASAARRISASLIHSGDDLASELDTRQRHRIASSELDKISPPPPTVPVDRLDLGDVDEDAATRPPAITMNMRAAPNTEADAARDEDDEDDGIPTLSDEDQEETTSPRDTPLDLMIRLEAEGPIGSAFFQPLPADRRDAVLERFHRKSVRKGTTVIRQGEVGHSLVVVAKGQLDVRVTRANGPALELAGVATGEFIGEASLLARTPAPALVVAATDCELLLLTPRDFYEIAGAFPALWAELKDVAQRRTRELDTRMKR